MSCHHQVAPDLEMAGEAKPGSDPIESLDLHFLVELRAQGFDSFDNLEPTQGAQMILAATGCHREAGLLGCVQQRGSGAYLDDAARGQKANCEFHRPRLLDRAPAANPAVWPERRPSGRMGACRRLVFS